MTRRRLTCDELAAVSAAEGRVLLTRDRDVLKRRIVTRGYFVRADDPRRQLVEVFRRFDLYRVSAPFTRCNGLLREIVHRLAPLTRCHYDTFRICGGCGQVYWRGSHVRAIEPLIESLAP